MFTKWNISELKFLIRSQTRKQFNTLQFNSVGFWWLTSCCWWLVILSVKELIIYRRCYWSPSLTICYMLDLFLWTCMIWHGVGLYSRAVTKTTPVFQQIISQSISVCCDMFPNMCFSTYTHCSVDASKSRNLNTSGRRSEFQTENVNVDLKKYIC